jgi:hypothetical protein
MSWIFWIQGTLRGIVANVRNIYNTLSRGVSLLYVPLG